MNRAISLLDIGDRIAIRQLIDAYARCADRRDAVGQMALFTTDTVVQVFMDSKVAEPTFVVRGRDGLAPVFAELNQYHATTHFNGQSTVELLGEHGTGETYCIAHHLTVKDGTRTLMVASLRYLDKFVKQSGAWFFAERKLLVDWTETRPSTP
jgi:SnoaL-like domain